MKRKIIYVAIAVIVMNGMLLVSLFDIAQAQGAVDELRIPSTLLVAAIVEGIIALVIANKKWCAEASEKNRRREYHRYVCEKGKQNERPLSYAAYCEMLVNGKVTAIWGAGADTAGAE